VGIPVLLKHPWSGLPLIQHIWVTPFPSHHHLTVTESYDLQLTNLNMRQILNIFCNYILKLYKMKSYELYMEPKKNNILIQDDYLKYFTITQIFIDHTASIIRADRLRSWSSQTLATNQIRHSASTQKQDPHQ
jgi:hypothetical protein